MVTTTEIWIMVIVALVTTIINHKKPLSYHVVFITLYVTIATAIFILIAEPTGSISFYGSLGMQ